MASIVSKYWLRIDPRFRGIVLFVIVLLASNYLWELVVAGDDSEGPLCVTILTADVTAFFRAGISFFARVVHRLLGAFGFPNLLINGCIYHPNGHAVRIVAGCTAFKQSFIMLAILAFARGPWLHKLWYVPAALLLLTGFNICRLTALGWLVIDHAELFELFHAHLLKYLFYGFIFAIWLLWDEVLRPRLLPLTQS